MPLTTTHLMQAMAEAKRLSRAGLVLSVALTDEGFVVMGCKDGRHAAKDIGWFDIEERPGRLIDALRSVRGLLV